MIYEKASNHTFFIDHFRDGDTVEGFITCRCCGQTHHDVVRVLAVESWEPKGSTRVRATTTAQALTALYRGQSGLLIPANIRRDRYHRVLADVLFGNISLAQLLVRDGFAWYGVGEPEPTTTPFVASDAG